MSDAMIGYDTEFRIKPTPAAAEFTPLAEVYSVTPPEASIDQVEVTSFKSPGRKREYIPALGDNGTASCEMNFVPGSATDLLIEALITSGSVVGAEIEYPNATVVAFNCSVSGYSKGVPVDDRMTATVEFQVTGAVTITPGPEVAKAAGSVTEPVTTGEEG
ncbi:phage tail tube protein [Paracoccus onubensis]|uniref:phage tail tube protein n=1 Tax=Paracoccus onubensis TaxID=1675788 RepID=UPI00160269A8|nr:phage tail tube protein [Paracoccus onubensis]